MFPFHNSIILGLQIAKNIGKKELPFKEESVGSQNLYTLGAKIIEALEIGSVLVVDELDTSLHPFITRMILMMFLDDDLNTNGAQLIFTTHDVTLLDQDLVRKDQVWITEKNQEGSTDLYSLQDFEGLREDTPFEKYSSIKRTAIFPAFKTSDKFLQSPSSFTISSVFTLGIFFKLSDT